MSNAKQETIADIVAEMRSNEFDDPSFNVYSLVAARTLARGWADRIEAAVNQPVTNCNRLGNAAAMREVAELRECLKETMADAVAEYKNNSCFRNVKCGEIERCGTCKVMKWRKALEGASND